MLSYLKNFFKPRIVIVEVEGEIHYAVRTWEFGEYVSVRFPKEHSYSIIDLVLEYCLCNETRAKEVLAEYKDKKKIIKVKKYASN